MHAAERAFDKLLTLNWRARKYAYQRLHPARDSMPVFIVGSQRSGTNMLLATLDRSFETWIYNEARRSAAFANWRIHPIEVLDSLIRRSYAKCVIFKPLCDSQWIDRLLGVHPNARAIWLYRHYRDVAGSAVREWGAHAKTVVGRIAKGELEAVGWRGERISQETVSLVRRLYSPEMSDFAGAALRWYVRNQTYFDLALQRRSDVILARYEDLVLSPDKAFLALFGYLGLQYERRFAEQISSSSVGRFMNVDLPDEVERLCNSMLERFDAVYETRWARFHD